MRSHLLVTIISIGLLWFPANTLAESKKNKFLEIQTIESANDIKAWLVEDHTIPVIALQFSFLGAGSKTNPIDKQGLAQLASNTMDEGAGDIKSQEFQKLLTDNSITLRFNASRDNFGGQIRTLTRHKDKAFELLKLALTKPRFDAAPVERMRASNKSRLKSSLSNPQWMAARIQNDKIFEGHPYALNSGGTLKTLENITSKDLHAFHKTLGKNQLIVSVAGDITASELRSLLDNIFSEIPDVKPTTTEKFALRNAGETYIYKQNIPQTIISISQQGITHEDPDYHTAKVMNFILGESGFGSRLMEEIREKRGLTYGIYSYFREYKEMDALHISTSTVNDKTKEILKITHEQWDLMKKEPVSEQELKDAKSYLIGSLPLSLTSTVSIANLLQSMQNNNLPINYLDKRSDEIQKVTKDDIQRVAKKLLDKSSFTTILVGNPQGIEGAEIISQLPNVE